MCQWVAVEDAPEMAQLLDTERESMEQIIEEEQAHRMQVPVLTQMQLQAMERMEEQGRELRRLSALLVEHQEVMRSSPERSQQEPPEPLPPRELGQLRHEVEVPCHRLGLIDNPVPQKDLYEKGFGHSLQVAVTEFRKITRKKGGQIQRRIFL